MELRVDDIIKSYGKTKALDRVSVSFSPGSIYAVLGENGAGKSTLLKLLAGILVPDQGSILMDGETFVRKRIDLRRRQLFTPDFPVLFGDQTVLTNIVKISSIYQADISHRVDDIAAFLEACGMSEHTHRTVTNLSRGQAWKAGMAVAHALQPELWLIDEPFASGMDLIGINAFKQLVRGLAAKGSTIIYTTQLIELAAGFADHVLILRDGRLAKQITGKELAADLAQSADGGNHILADAKADAPNHA